MGAQLRNRAAIKTHVLHLDQTTRKFCGEFLGTREEEKERGNERDERKGEQALSRGGEHGVLTDEG